MNLNFISLVVLQSSKICMFLDKFTVEQVLKSFSDFKIYRNHSLELPVFGLSNSLPYGLKESRELRILIIWVLSYQAFRNAKHFCQRKFFAFQSHHYEFAIQFEILNFLFLISYQKQFQFQLNIIFLRLVLQGT